MSTVQKTIRCISSSAAANYHIDRHLKKLKKSYNIIGKCKIIVDLAKNNTHKDKLYSVCIDTTILGKELVSKKRDSNLFIAIRNTFLALEHLLEKNYKKKKVFNKKRANPLRHYIIDTMS